MQRLIDRGCKRQLGATGAEFRGRRRHARTSAALAVLLLGGLMPPLLAEEPAGKDLRVFYQQNCSRCHGPDGSARSTQGKPLRGQDFTDPAWLRGAQDAALVRTILKGKFFGLAMPAFKGALTEDEAQRMVTDIVRQSRKGQVIASEASVPAPESPGSKP